MSGISSGNIYHKWAFGDNSTSTVRNPAYVYKNAGNYQVILRINSDYGCVDSTLQMVYVYKNPTVFLGEDTTIFDNQSITLNAGSGFSSYLWQDSSTGSSIVIDGNATGKGVHSYHVRVTDQNECSASDTIVITIKEYIGLAENGKLYQLRIYPNPATDYINILLPTSTEEYTNLIILNSQGRRVAMEPIRSGGAQTIQYIVGHLPTGLYTIQIANGNLLLTEKLIISAQ